MKDIAAWLERKKDPNSYVYELAYPDGRVFYIGKGTGYRINRHEDETRRGVQSRKCDIIREIWASGGQVLKRKVCENLTSEEAIEIEQEVIQRHGIHNLANVSPIESTHQEHIVPLSISLFKEFREEIEDPIKTHMRRIGIEPTSQSCYQYLQSICIEAIRSHLNDASPE